MAPPPDDELDQLNTSRREALERTAEQRAIGENLIRRVLGRGGERRDSVAQNWLRQVFTEQHLHTQTESGTLPPAPFGATTTEAKIIAHRQQHGKAPVQPAAQVGTIAEVVDELANTKRADFSKQEHALEALSVADLASYKMDENLLDSLAKRIASTKASLVSLWRHQVESGIAHDPAAPASPGDGAQPARDDAESSIFDGYTAEERAEGDVRPADVPAPLTLRLPLNALTVLDEVQRRVGVRTVTKFGREINEAYWTTASRLNPATATSVPPELERARAERKAADAADAAEDEVTFQGDGKSLFDLETQFTRGVDQVLTEFAESIVLGLRDLLEGQHSVAPAPQSQGPTGVSHSSVDADADTDADAEADADTGIGRAAPDQEGKSPRRLMLPSEVAMKNIIADESQRHEFERRFLRRTLQNLVVRAQHSELELARVRGHLLRRNRLLEEQRGAFFRELLILREQLTQGAGDRYDGQEWGGLFDVEEFESRVKEFDEELSEETWQNRETAAARLAVQSAFLKRFQRKNQFERRRLVEEHKHKIKALKESMAQLQAHIDKLGEQHVAQLEEVRAEHDRAMQDAEAAAVERQARALADQAALHQTALDAKQLVIDRHAGELLALQTQLEGRIGNIETERNRLVTELARVQGILDIEQSVSAARLKEAADEHAREKAQLQNEVNTLAEKASIVQLANDELSNKLVRFRETTAANVKLRMQLAVKASRVGTLETSMDTANEQIRNLEMRVAELEHELDSRGDDEEMTAELWKARAETERALMYAQDVQQMYTNLCQNYDSLAEVRIGDLRDKRRQLEGEPDPAVDPSVTGQEIANEIESLIRRMDGHMVSITRLSNTSAYGSTTLPDMSDDGDAVATPRQRRRSSAFTMAQRSVSAHRQNTAAKQAEDTLINLMRSMEAADGELPDIDEAPEAEAEALREEEADEEEEAQEGGQVGEQEPGQEPEQEPVQEPESAPPSAEPGVKMWSLLDLQAIMARKRESEEHLEMLQTAPSPPQDPMAPVNSADVTNATEETAEMGQASEEEPEEELPMAAWYGLWESQVADSTEEDHEELNLVIGQRRLRALNRLAAMFHVPAETPDDAEDSSPRASSRATLALSRIGASRQGSMRSLSAQGYRRDSLVSPRPLHGQPSQESVRRPESARSVTSVVSQHDPRAASPRTSQIRSVSSLGAMPPVPSRLSVYRANASDLDMSETAHVDIPPLRLVRAQRPSSAPSSGVPSLDFDDLAGLAVVNVPPLDGAEPDEEGTGPAEEAAEGAAASEGGGMYLPSYRPREARTVEKPRPKTARTREYVPVVSRAPVRPKTALPQRPRPPLQTRPRTAGARGGGGPSFAQPRRLQSARERGTARRARAVEASERRSKMLRALYGWRLHLDGERQRLAASASDVDEDGDRIMAESIDKLTVVAEALEQLQEGIEDGEGSAAPAARPMSGVTRTTTEIAGVKIDALLEHAGRPAYPKVAAGSESESKSKSMPPSLAYLAKAPPSSPVIDGGAGEDSGRRTSVEQIDEAMAADAQLRGRKVATQWELFMQGLLLKSLDERPPSASESPRRPVRDSFFVRRSRQQARDRMEKLKTLKEALEQERMVNMERALDAMSLLVGPSNRDDERPATAASMVSNISVVTLPTAEVEYESYHELPPGSPPPSPPPAAAGKGHRWLRTESVRRNKERFPITSPRGTAVRGAGFWAAK